MLDELDKALERVLTNRLPYAEGDLKISFDTPGNTFSGDASKPTVNLFLWDIRRSADESHAGRFTQEVDSADPRRRVWQQRAPRFEFQYLLTAWTRDENVKSEHKLLGESLKAILGCPMLADDESPDFVAEHEPAPTVRVARTDSKDLADFWGAVEGKLRPGLNVVVTLSIEPTVIEDEAAQTGAPDPTLIGLKTADDPIEMARVDSLESEEKPPGPDGHGRVTIPDPTSPRHQFAGRSEAIGAEVRSPRGITTVSKPKEKGEPGTYVVTAEPGDVITIDGDPPESFTVPAAQARSSEPGDD